MSYRHTLSERVALESQLQLLSGRQIAIAGAQKTIPGHSRLDVKGSYSALSHLEVWAAVRNVLDDDTEYWAGYREMPFTVQIGLSYTL